MGVQEFKFQNTFLGDAEATSQGHASWEEEEREERVAWPLADDSVPDRKQTVVNDGSQVVQGAAKEMATRMATIMALGACDSFQGKPLSLGNLQNLGLQSE